ncbi:MAG: sugar phosphate nucleotidyltransferase, partial [Sediminispirochaetaceae bacterium]
MKGLIVAAGYGTRFLPVTKTVPKEMLPLITKPSIAFIIEEFLSAGIEEIVILSSRRKKSLEDFLDREMELEGVFSREGSREKLARIEPYKANFAFVHQQEMRGTGHALL